MVTFPMRPTPDTGHSPSDTLHPAPNRCSPMPTVVPHVAGGGVCGCREGLTRPRASLRGIWPRVFFWCARASTQTDIERERERGLRCWRGGIGVRGFGYALVSFGALEKGEDRYQAQNSLSPAAALHAKRHELVRTQKHCRQIPVGCFSRAEPILRGYLR